MGYLGPSAEDDAEQAYAQLGYKPPEPLPPGSIRYFDGSGPPRLIRGAPDLQLAPPGPLEGTGEAIAQGVAGVADSITNALADVGGMIHNALPQGVQHVFDWTPFQTEPDWQKSVSQGRENLEKWIDSDKQYQGVGAQTIGGAVKGVTTFGAGFAVGGPIGAAVLMGGTSADDTYRDLTSQGVDDTTAKEAALGQGIVGAASAAVPFKFGGGMLAKVFKSSAINAGLGVAGRGANWAVLKANGYDDMAAMQRPLDGQALAADAIVGAGMGFAGHLHETYFGDRGRIAPFDRPAPSDVDTARVVADQARAADMAPGVPTSPEAAALHHAIFSRVTDDLANGRSANVTAEEARGIAAGTIPDPAKMEAARAIDEGMQSDPIVQEANTMADALRAAEAQVDANIPDFALPVGESGSAQRPQTLQEATMAQIGAKHGAMSLETEDGSAATVSNIVARMRAEIANAESDRGLMTAAIACFARTGGVL